MDVGDSAPIKQHPYRVSSMKKEFLDREVQYMLKNDIIEESEITGVPHASKTHKTVTFTPSAYHACVLSSGFLAGTFPPSSSRNVLVCNTKRFISVQGYAVWNEKCSSNIPKNG